MKRARIYTDGGARNNPGPAAAGAVIYSVDADGNLQDKVAEVSEYLGKTTNNQAEYSAIILGLKKAKELGFESIEVLMDSQLAVRQLSGEYKVKSEELAKKFIIIHDLRYKFHDLRFSHIPREMNKEADALVNKAIDQALGL